MASNSGWSTEIPSGSSSIAQGDDDIRSFKSFMQAWWEEEHYATDGSASSAGIAKHGAGRAFVGTASQLSNPTADNDGRLFWVTDTQELRIGQLSSSSWSVASDNIQLSSANTWTALQEFTSGISTSQLSISGGHLVAPSTFQITSVATSLHDFHIGSDNSISIRSDGAIEFKVVSGHDTPSADSIGSVAVIRGGSNYELVVRWGDGTQDVIATGPVL